MLTDYKNKRDKILNQYEKILKLSNILPRDIKIEDVKKKKRQLEEEHFFVSFTGQIKAGKSTLINALIFGDEIIPADDTPHTAKITIIKYGEKPQVEATFYNRAEWEQLENNRDFFKKFLEPDIEQSIKKGLYIEEFIKTKAKIKQENTLNNLKEYVARGGKYTPYVNLVTLYYPNEILKDITIVDTPGTNDPNEQRDRVAKEWIHKTNANIYITYANQALDAVDIKFIDKFLLGVPKNQKLTVINKIDSVNDTNELEEYIDELLSDRTLKLKEIVSDRESLILVSGLGALIDKMLNNNLTLNSDLKEYAKKLNNKGLLESTKHGLPKLGQMIEKKLIENKGKNIINSHSKFLNYIFVKKINEIEPKLNEKKSTLFDLMKSKKELEIKEKSIDKLISFIEERIDKISKNFKKLVKESLDNFYIRQNKQNKENINYIENKIKQITNTSNYRNELKWIVKDALNNNLDELRSVFNEMRDKLTKKINNDIDNLKCELIEKDKDISINLIPSLSLDIYTLEFMEQMQKLADENFSEDIVKKIVKKNSNIFQRIFDTEKGLEKIDSAIMNEVREYFKKSDAKNKSLFGDKIETFINKDIFQKIVNELKKIMDAKKAEIKRYSKDIKDKEILFREVKKEKEILEQELKRVQKYKEILEQAEEEAKKIIKEEEKKLKL